MRIGFIARMDNSGLGILSDEFTKHVRPNKVLIVRNKFYHSFPERYSDFDVKIVDRGYGVEAIDWLTKDIDLLVAVETPYHNNIFHVANHRGIKTILMPMYESLPESPKFKPDLYLCPSLLDLKEAPEPKKYLPFPVNRGVIPFKLRKKAMVFLHNAGHGGIAGRNGTDELLRAIPMVKNRNIRFVINSQTGLDCGDSRVTVNVGNVKNYWDMWREGDVFIFPEKFNGLSLPINEALSAGMTVMSSDRFPFNEWLPKGPLIPVHGMTRARVSVRLVDYAIIRPEDIAVKIDEFAEKNIAKLSKRSDKIAEDISWERLLPKYLKVFEELCRN